MVILKSDCYLIKNHGNQYDDWSNDDVCDCHDVYCNRSANPPTRIGTRGHVESLVGSSTKPRQNIDFGASSVFFFEKKPPSIATKPFCGLAGVMSGKAQEATNGSKTK